MKRPKKTVKPIQTLAQKPQKGKRVRVGKLQSMPEVALFQARLIKMAMKDGGVSVNDAYKVTMMTAMLAKTLEVTDLEKRIAALEKKYTQIIG